MSFIALDHPCRQMELTITVRFYNICDEAFQGRIREGYQPKELKTIIWRKAEDVSQNNNKVAPICRIYSQLRYTCPDSGYAIENVWVTMLMIVHGL